MPWLYKQLTGELVRMSFAMEVSPRYSGYSGHGEGKNNPALQSVAFVGPIPVGTYLISTAFEDPEKGPVVMRLTPMPDTETFGRDAFLMHGDSITDPGNASEGCICQDRDAREAVSDSSDYILNVVSS